MTNERSFLICMLVGMLSAMLAAAFHCTPLLLVTLIAFVWGIREALKKDE